jgi:hypothetical protein
LTRRKIRQANRRKPEKAEKKTTRQQTADRTSSASASFSLQIQPKSGGSLTIRLQLFLFNNIPAHQDIKHIP